MRRLWSYVILTGASLLLMGASFNNIVKQTTSNIEYSDGKEMVFRISDKDSGVDLEEKDVNGNVPSELIANSMIKRLDSLSITNYEVSTESYDTVKVTLKQDTDENYENVKKLMAFDGSLALSSKLDDFRVNKDENEKFITGNAYLETKNDYPSVNIPVGDHFKELYDIVKKYKEDNNTEAAESSTSGEGEDAETTYTYNLYLWHDYEDGNTFSQTQSGNEDYDEKVAEKIFMNFDIAELEKLEEDGKEINNLTAFVNVQDANSNQKYEASEVRKAFDTARFYVSLINCGSLDYKVTFLYENSVNAITEQLVSTDGHLLWTSTLRATIVCVVILCLLLAVFYRLSTLATATLTLGSVFAGIGSLIWFTAEFNAAGLIALCAVAVVSLVSSVIYLTKLKEEAYRGRSLKKANTEASKKSLLPIVDVNVLLIIVGIFCYVLGGSLMRSFAIISVIGGIASLVLNTIVLKLLMWLATNTTKLQGKYEVFGIDSKNVPNLLKEEKQTYYGNYANKDFTKKRKLVGIFASVLFVAGLTGMIVFGSLNKGVVYNNGGTVQNSEIFVETNSEHTLITEQAIRDILANTYTYEKDEKKSTSLDKQISDILYKTREDVDEDKQTVYYSYYVIKLNSKINDDKYNAYYITVDGEGKETSRTYSNKEEGGISALINSQIFAIDEQVSTSLKAVDVKSVQQPEFAPVMYGTLVGIAVASFYLLLRYRLSRGLASFVITSLVTGIVAGFFAYTRLAVTNYAVVVIPVVALFTLVTTVLYLNKEREMVLEDKNKDNSFENREAIMIKSTSFAYSSALLVSILAIYVGINFFGFGAANNAWLFLVMIVGIFAALFFVTNLLGPVGQFFYKLFSKVNIEKFTSKFKGKKKKKVVNTPRSAEPEERIFIGIND